MLSFLQSRTMISRGVGPPKHLALVLDDLESEDLHTHAPALVVPVPAGGPPRARGAAPAAAAPPAPHTLKTT